MTRALRIGLAVWVVAACAQPDPVYQRTIYTFGTLASISLYDLPRDQAVTTANEIERTLARLNRDWYAWGDGTLGELNRMLARSPRVAIDAELAQLIGRAFEFQRQSQGLFNPAVGEYVELWGFHDSDAEASLPDQQDLNAIDSPLGVRLTREGDQFYIETDRPGIILDLGGIAKGAALGVCRDILLAANVKRALIDLGGDLIAISDSADPPFSIGVRDPRAAGVIALLQASGGEAVVTSGDYERFFDQANERYHHIIDPETGYPSVATAAVTVVDVDPIRADAAATALMVGGPLRFEALAEKLEVRYATLITADGQVLHTAAMAERVAAAGTSRGNSP